MPLHLCYIVFCIVLGASCSTTSAPNQKVMLIEIQPPVQQPTPRYQSRPVIDSRDNFAKDHKLIRGVKDSNLLKSDIDHLYVVEPRTNIRAMDLKQIKRNAKLNEQVRLTGKKQSPSDSNFAFQEVIFDDGNTGWVASHHLKPIEESMGKSRKIQINLTTNRLNFFVDGKLRANWNIGSGKDNDDNVTPVGNFKVLHKDRCSVWLPKNKEEQGPCRATNPLGDFQVWFHKGRTYGLHGTNEEHLIREGTNPDERRVSGGCVRNPNEKIAWLFRRIKVGDFIEIGYFGAEDKPMLTSTQKDQINSVDSTN